MDTPLGTTRPRLPRRCLGAAPAALLLAALAACGTGGGGDAGGDGAAGPSAEPDPDTRSALAAAAEDAELVSASNAGGQVDPRATVLGDRAAVDRFTRPFEGSNLPARLRQTWSRADPGGDETVVAAVVDVSCEAPAAVEVRSGAGGLLVSAAGPAPQREIQCLVPVTAVAVLTVPAGAV